MESLKVNVAALERSDTDFLVVLVASLVGRFNDLRPSVVQSMLRDFKDGSYTVRYINTHEVWSSFFRPMENEYQGLKSRLQADHDATKETLEANLLKCMQEGEAQIQDPRGNGR